VTRPLPPLPPLGVVPLAVDPAQARVDMPQAWDAPLAAAVVAYVVGVDGALASQREGEGVRIGQADRFRGAATGRVRDVTRRYVLAWGARTLRLRSHVPAPWWADAVGAMYTSSVRRRGGGG
jgi:hypothetical protein